MPRALRRAAEVRFVVRTFPAGSLLAVLAASAALAPAAAAAHGVVAEVDQREGAVAVRVRHHGDRPLAGARYEIRSPVGGDGAWAEGRTDRHGWIAFTPDAAGRWQVRVVDDGGHGKVVEVDVPEATVAARSAARPGGATGSPPTIELAPEGGGAGRGAGAAAPAAGDTGGGHALRVLAGVTAIVVAFRLLLAIQRARRARGR